MDTNARRKQAEWWLKNILNALQGLDSTERAKAMGLIGIQSVPDREKLIVMAKELNMPLAAERIWEVRNVTVASTF